MHPLICEIGPLKIYSYGLMLVLAFFIAAFLADKEAKKRKFPTDFIWNIGFISTVLGIIGARIFYVLENIKFYFNNPLEIIILQHGGLSWFGGFILGGLVAIYYSKKKKIPVLKTLDLFAPYLALAQGIGRLGCFLNGCCYGKASLSGMYFPVHGEMLIPTQLYSSLALILIFIFLRYLQSKPLHEGAVICSYLILYSTKRFIVEFFRNDNSVFISGLTLFQVIALLLFISTSICLFSIIKKPKA